MIEEVRPIDSIEWQECADCWRKYGRRMTLLFIKGKKLNEKRKEWTPFSMFYCPFENKEVYQARADEYWCPECWTEITSDRPEGKVLCRHQVTTNGVRGGHCNTLMEKKKNIIYMKKTINAAN